MYSQRFFIVEKNSEIISAGKKIRMKFNVLLLKVFMQDLVFKFHAQLQ